MVPYWWSFVVGQRHDYRIKHISVLPPPGFFPGHSVTSARLSCEGIKSIIIETRDQQFQRCPLRKGYPLHEMKHSSLIEYWGNVMRVCVDEKKSI